MSGTLLGFPRKPHELADDLESFVYVISLALLRFHKHDLSFIDVRGKRPKLAKHISIMFDAADKAEGGYVVGGEGKIEAMVYGHPGFKLASGNSPQLSVLLKELYELGKEHYSKLDLDTLQAKYGAARLPKLQPLKPESNDQHSEEEEEEVVDMSTIGRHASASAPMAIDFGGHGTDTHGHDGNPGSGGEKIGKSKNDGANNAGASMKHKS